MNLYSRKWALFQCWFRVAWGRPDVTSVELFIVALTRSVTATTAVAGAGLLSGLVVMVGDASLPIYIRSVKAK